MSKNDDQAEYDAARERATTARYAEMRQHHARVERTLAAMVRYHDGRRSRYWGQWRVKIHYLRTGLVVNVNRMVKLLCPSGAPGALQMG